MDNDYIVYVGKLEDRVVYVGQGKKGRELHLNSGISHVYEANKEHFSGNLIDIEVVHQGLTKEFSVELEKELILSLQPIWNKTFTKRSELVRKFNLVLKKTEHLLKFNNKLALIYACKDKISGEGSAIIKTSDVQAIGGDMRKILHLHRTRKKTEDAYSIVQIKQGLYEVQFKTDWLKYLEFKILNLIKIAEKRRMKCEK